MFQDKVILSRHSNYKIGGPAEYFYAADKVEKIIRAVEKAGQEKLPIFILGGGTNLLISDNGFAGLILKPDIKLLKSDGILVKVGAGILVSDLLDLAASKGLSGLEWAGGLPGTLGGAVRGNAGAFGGEIKDCIKEIVSLDISGKKPIIKKRNNKQCRFGYRDSIFKQLNGKEIILEALEKHQVQKKPEGAIFIDLSKEGLGEKILLRGDGTSIYITQDIYLAILKYKEFKFDKSIFVSAVEQKHHFKVLFTILKKWNPTWAKKIENNYSERHNPRRLIRAIEIVKSLPVDTRCPQIATWELNSQVVKIGLTLPPEKLKEKIRLRLFARVRAGMIAEAEKLHRQGLPWKRMEELGLQYRYLARHLRDEISKKEMIEKLSTEIWRYAKRQMTWFKRDKKINWFKPKEIRSIMKTAEEFM